MMDQLKSSSTVWCWWWCVVVLAVTTGVSAGKAVEEYVVALDNSNFTDFVNRHSFIVVEFYAPWCGHCKTLAPEYEKAASELSKHNPPITLAKVDASDDSNRGLATLFEIQGFPTIKILRDGGKIVQELKGSRDAEGIVSYIKKQLGPASVEINSPADAEQHINDNKVFVAGVFPLLFSSDEFDNFTKLAEKWRADYDFGHTSDAKLLKRGEPSVDKPTIRVLKPFDELFVDSHDFDLGAAEKFIEESTVPSVTIFDQNPSNQPYLAKYFQSDDAKAMLLLNFSSEDFGELKSKFQDIAILFKGNNINFLLGDLESSQAIIQYYSLEQEQPPVILIEKKADEKYLKSNLKADQLVRWFKQYLDGKLKSFKKSEPVPLVNDEPVKVVVADSIKEFVLDSPENVLLEFYAPWCGHCQKLAPILDEVALSYEDDPNVIIAKFDATANDVPSDYFKVEGFPAVYFKSSKGEISEYEGYRTKQDIIDFIEKHRAGSDAADSVNHATKPEEDADDSGKDEL